MYWPFCHREAVEKMGKHPITGPYKVMHMYLIHLFPTIACILNSLVTNCILKRDLWWQILQAGIFYSGIQYFFQWRYDIVLYQFLDFKEGPKALLIVSAMLCGTCLIKITSVTRHQSTIIQMHRVSIDMATDNVLDLETEQEKIGPSTKTINTSTNMNNFKTITTSMISI